MIPINPNNGFCWLNAHIFQRNRLFFCRKRSWWTLIYQIFHCKDEMIWICTSWQIFFAKLTILCDTRLPDGMFFLSTRKHDKKTYCAINSFLADYAFSVMSLYKASVTMYPRLIQLVLNAREFVESIEDGNANDGEKKTFNWCLQNNVKDMGFH